MKAKFMFSLICVAAVMLTACEEYPYGYGGYGYRGYGYRGYGYGGYGYGGYGYRPCYGGGCTQTVAGYGLGGYGGYGCTTAYIPYGWSWYRGTTC